MRAEQERHPLKEAAAMMLAAFLGTTAAVIILALILNALLNSYLRTHPLDPPPDVRMHGPASPETAAPSGR